MNTVAGGLGLVPLAAVMETLPDGLVVLDPAGTVCYLNPAGARLLGRRPDQLLGRNLVGDLPDATGAMRGLLQDARRSGRPVVGRGGLTPQGTRTSVTAVPVGELLHVYLREATGDPTDWPTTAGARVPPGAPARAADADRATDADRLRFLAEVTETMIGTLDTGESATKLAELAVSRLCDWAVVVLNSEDGGPGKEGRAHRDPALRADVDTYRDGRLRRSGNTPIVTALRTGQPVRVALDDARIAPTLPSPEVQAAWRRLDTSSAAIVPLRAHGETFGVLAMMNAGARPPHTPTELATAVEVARRGALSLDNARLYGRQLKVAETLQRSLLTLPGQTAPEHLQFAVRYRPATSHQAVGGDWYDCFQQPDGATQLVIGDVVGHSVEAAAAMGQVRSMLRALAYDRPGSPALTLTRLDRVLTGLHVDAMASALVARVEQSARRIERDIRTLHWSSAGHVPPLLLRPGGEVHVLDRPPERLLGTGWTGPRRDHEVPLHPGDTVLLVTDGLVEHGRYDIDRGMTRLTDVLAELWDLPVEELCDQLFDRILAGGSDDDVAVLALRCHPRPRSAPLSMAAEPRPDRGSRELV
ncbi:MAG: putative sensor protein [Blastococcus sp.]|jgi:sigma-B regulation protein RsbU (phosphoserine phosphatase)|nr:putative sensor protein [Blastococcus sp.]